MELPDLPPKFDPKGGSPRTPVPIPVSEMHLNGKVITAQTGISLGLIVIFIDGVAWILTAISSLKSDIKDTKTDLSSDIRELKGRMQAVEAQKNGWSAVQMLQWSIHLKELNSNGQTIIKDGLKVPEPQIEK